MDVSTTRIEEERHTAFLGDAELRALLGQVLGAKVGACTAHKNVAVEVRFSKPPTGAPDHAVELAAVQAEVTLIVDRRRSPIDGAPY